MLNLWVVFLTGLTVGGLTCMAVQFGLLATTIAQRKEEELKEGVQTTGNVLPLLSFLGAKLIAYTLLGVLLGWFGSLFQLSLTAQIVMQVVVVVFMIGTAFNLLNVHPLFRYFVIQPPKFLFRLVRNQAKSQTLLAPVVLGAFTVFIPCGTTQAMMALAIASGSPILGASTMFAFTLGTAPVFFILGYLATRASDIFKERFMKVAASGILLLALFNLNNVIALSGFDLTIKSVWKGFYCTVSFCDDSSLLARAANGSVLGAAVNQATITIEQTGYTPNAISVKTGSPVTLNLVNQGGSGCTQSFTIPKLGIRKVVPLGSSDSIQFTAPREKGQLAFMCSMGMFRGMINVI